MTKALGQGLTIRSATPADFQGVCELNAQVQQLHSERWPELFKAPRPAILTRDAYDAWLRTPTRHVLVADIDGEVVGYAVADVQHRPENPYRFPLDVLYIEQIGVRPDRRRCGCARALVEAITSLPSTKATRRVELDVWGFNEDAREAFQSMGFEPILLRMKLRES